MAFASATLIAFPDDVDATTRTMFAPGAIAWAYSTSRLVSIDQPISSWNVLLGANAGHPPVGHRIVKEGGAAMPKVLSKTVRSFWTVGLPNASTMSIVWPVPSRVEGRLYAARL